MSSIEKIKKRSLHPDFPVEPILGSVSGIQPKLLLTRGEEGNYVSPRRSMSDVMVRFEAADDVVSQLRDYFLRKKKENPDWTDEKNFERIKLGIAAKAASGKWPFSVEEQVWIMDRLRERI